MDNVYGNLRLTRLQLHEDSLRRRLAVYAVQPGELQRVRYLDLLTIDRVAEQAGGVPVSNKGKVHVAHKGQVPVFLRVTRVLGKCIFEEIKVLFEIDSRAPWRGVDHTQNKINFRDFNNYNFTVVIRVLTYNGCTKVIMDIYCGSPM